jgi:large subunit ribosomal protein L25
MEEGKTMETKTLTAEVRNTSGKGPARQLRVRGLIPAVLYGPGGETTSLSVSPRDLIKALTNPLGQNTVLSLQIDGRAELAMCKEVTYHPISRQAQHADFYRVTLDREVLVNVPFQTTGRAAGVQAGGVLKMVQRSLPVRALPANIPSFIEVDVSHLQMLDVIPVKEVPVPAGVRIAMPANQTLVSVVGEKREEEEEAAKPAEGAAAAEGAAPAADAAAKSE